VIDEVIRSGLDAMVFAPLRETDDPVRTLLDLIRQKSERTTLESVTLGCPLNNLMQEMSPLDPEFKRRLTDILTEVADIIGANILNVARQDYDPQGASVTILISEQPVIDKADAKGVISDAVVAHLDKSHITVHTYPETHPDNGIATFRADIDVSTCGVISPLKALNYLIESLESDIVVMDYRVRGFTRDVKGKKHYIDHKINSIQDYLAKNVKARYEMLDVNVYQENLFHTKMHLKDFDLDKYLFEEKAKNLSFKERMKIEARLKREIEELYHGRNLID